MDRYHRQKLLPEWGEDGQARLAAAHVLLVGCGALGCEIADLLARAGVGRLTIVDRDVVEITNLQRQTLFTESDVADGLPKAEAARRRLAAVNSEVRVVAAVADFSARNAEKLCADATLVMDGTDNFETRYLINDLAVKRGIPYVYGGAVGTRGMAMTVLPGKTPCLRCVFEEPPPPGTAATCDTAGVLGPIIATVAAYQATEATKIMVGKVERVAPVLMETDLWSGVHRRVDIAKAKRDDCPCCGLRRFEFLDGGRGGQTAALCGQNAVQIAPGHQQEVDLAGLAARLAPHGSFMHMPTLLVRGMLSSERGENGDPILLTVFADGRAIVKGTHKPETARSIYARYVGA